MPKYRSTTWAPNESEPQLRHPKKLRRPQTTSHPTPARPPRRSEHGLLRTKRPWNLTTELAVQIDGFHPRAQDFIPEATRDGLSAYDGPAPATYTNLCGANPAAPSLATQATATQATEHHAGSQHHEAHCTATERPRAQQLRHEQLARAHQSNLQNFSWSANRYFDKTARWACP